MLIRCSENRSLICATRRRNTNVLWASHLPHNWCWFVEIVICASWNIHKHIYYD